MTRYSKKQYLKINRKYRNVMSGIQLRKATRTKAKIRLGLSAVSGGGKTYSSLLIAKGLAGGNMKKIALIDTENGSGDLYANLGDYNVITLEAPYTPERYIECIKACENAGMEVIIVDSITHEWDGKGGILEISNSMAGNSYTNWAKLTPRHQSFIDCILQSKCHVITTVRRKQDYEMTTNSAGKLVPQKVGLKEVTREGFEYELTVNIELDTNHNASASKDRTGLFAGHPEFKPSEETGRLLLEWCEDGVIVLTPLEKAKKEMAEVTTLDELKTVWSRYKSLQTDNEFLASKDKRKEELTPKTVTDGEE